MLSQRARSRSRNRSSVDRSWPISMSEVLGMPSLARASLSASASRVQAGAKMATEQPRSNTIFIACNTASVTTRPAPAPSQRTCVKLTLFYF